jgi:predicted lipoprotein with Yx(FWY)xxD motif
MSQWRTAAVVVAAVGTLGCSGCGSSSAHVTSKPPVLTVATNSTLGRYLVVGGRSLYMYPPDKQRKVTCTHAYACAQAWPPLFVKPGQRAIAGTGVTQRLIGSLPGDGGRVVTYNHWPLYYYEGDLEAGQIHGQDQSFDWFVISPTGTPIHSGPRPSTAGHSRPPSRRCRRPARPRCR